MAIASATLALLAALWLAGCDPQRVAQLEEGVSTEVEVRKQFGDPVTITTQPDGTRIFDYPRQPEGWTNYVITIGPDGKMSSLRQLLNPDNFARVQPGLAAQEVRQLLGRPAQTKRYDLKNEEVWDWRFKQNGQDSKLFSVTFGADGKVLSTATSDDPREIANGGK
ncbi:MAG: outer membrane protein assembly factor BamE [Rubrivivax sp.]|nr:outer membrane protein assembly factor BamE [Rubrivivax sp.]